MSYWTFPKYSHRTVFIPWNAVTWMYGNSFCKIKFTVRIMSLLIIINWFYKSDILEWNLKKGHTVKQSILNTFLGVTFCSGPKCHFIDKSRENYDRRWKVRINVVVTKYVRIYAQQHNLPRNKWTRPSSSKSGSS